MGSLSMIKFQRLQFNSSKSTEKSIEELNSPAVSALRRVIAEVKQRWSVIEWVTKYL
jgi:hypothetical protein